MKGGILCIAQWNNTNKEKTALYGIYYCQFCGKKLAEEE